MGIIKQKHEQKSEKRDISRMSRTVVMTRELVRVLVIAVTAMVCVGGYKDIAAAGEILNPREFFQQRTDLYAQKLHETCKRKRHVSFLQINQELTMVKQQLVRIRNQAHPYKITAIVKQCNGLLKEFYQCLTDSLVYTLTHILTKKNSNEQRTQLLELVRSEEWGNDISAIPKIYIYDLQQAETTGFPTFNFNLEREKREGLARDMNAAILRAADVYNKALEAEGGDALKKFGIQLSPEQIAAVKSMAAAPGEAGAGAQMSEADFQLMLQKKDKELYQTYKDIVLDMNRTRWVSLYLVTMQPRQEEAKLDYIAHIVPKLSPEIINIEKKIEIVSNKFGVKDRLQAKHKEAKKEIIPNLEIWHQAIEQEAPTPISGGGGGQAAEALQAEQPTSKPEARVGDLPLSEFNRRLAEAQRLVGLLQNAVDSAKLVTQGVQQMDVVQTDLQEKHEKANNYILELAQATNQDERVLRLAKDPAFQAATAEIRRIVLARAGQQREEEEKQARGEERSLLQPTPSGSPVVGGAAGASPTVLSLMRESRESRESSPVLLPTAATPPSEPQIEPTVGKLPQSVYEERLAKVRGLIEDVKDAFVKSDSVDLTDIAAMEAMLDELETKEELAYNTAKSLRDDSDNASEAAELVANDMFYEGGGVLEREDELSVAIDQVKEWEKSEQQGKQ